MKRKKHLMFNYQIVMFVFALLTGLVSCSKDEETPTLSVSVSDNSAFDTNGGKKEIIVNSNVEWNIIKRYDGASGWLTTSMTKGKGSQTITATAGANRLIGERSMTLLFVCTTDASLSQELKFTQSGVKPILNVTPPQITLDTPYKNTVKIKIDCNTSWKISTECEWMDLSVKEGRENATISLSSTENDKDEERKCVINISAIGTQLTQQVEITQPGLSSLIYREPYISWGGTIAAAKDYMSGYELVEESKNYLIYNSKYKELFTSYQFDSGLLYNSTVTLNKNLSNIDDLKKQLQKVGYQSLGTISTDMSCFISNDHNTKVFIDNQSDKTILIHYYDFIHLFKSPYLIWNVDYKGVKSVMEERGYIVEDEGSLYDGSAYIVYNGKRFESESMYVFNHSSGLARVFIFLNPLFVSFEEVCHFLTSEMYYTVSQNFTSELGDVYESTDLATVAIVIPSSDDDPLHIRFLSFEEAKSIANNNNSRGQTRTNLVDDHSKVSKLLQKEQLHNK